MGTREIELTLDEVCGLDDFEGVEMVVGEVRAGVVEAEGMRGKSWGLVRTVRDIDGVPSAVVWTESELAHIDARFVRTVEEVQAYRSGDPTDEMVEAVRAYADTLLAEEHRLPQEGTTWRAHVARSLLGIIGPDGTPTDAAIEVEAIRLHEQKAGSGGEPWDSLWPYDQQKLRDQARVTLGLETDRD